MVSYPFGCVGRCPTLNFFFGYPRSRVCLNLTFGIIFLIFCGICVLAYRAKPLTDIKVSMGRVLASDKELIFDLHVKANNWNWWTVHVADADISLFAFSQVVPLGNGTVAQGKVYCLD